MLTNVPKQINRAARAVVLRHPNSMACTLWVKKFDREPSATPETFAGMPTIGGAGVLDGEDEAKFSYVAVAEARVVFTDRYMPATGNMIDTENALNYTAEPREALIECLAQPGTPEWVLPDKPMVFTWYPGNGVVIPYQIVGTTGSIEIPPYTRKYLVNPLSDSGEWPIDQSGGVSPEEPDDDVWSKTEW